ncbi:hypothetical protein FIE12Z_2750 [Fusarium flagelliforme]|uniref:DUF7735 domain-containing protein n=1 Tax=Fusarium flagelliforme TaxID=2675880 RepID=A0A395N0F9_9HYPO|nr:hypothetical protein FIE12Z_2750 [Fusarium flagelliforme]
MKPAVAIVLLQSSIVNGAIYDTLFPTAKPTTSDNDVDCMFEDFYPIFSAITPNGSLSTALLSYGDELIKDCPLTDVDVMGLPTCPYPALPDWCAFSDHVPTTLLPAWSSYGSSAWSWWSEHSSYAVKYAHVCKKKWFNAMIGVVYGSVRLNNTIHWGECYAQGQAQATMGDKIEATSTLTTEATTGMRATSTAPKETQQPSGITEGNTEKARESTTEDHSEESKGFQILARGADVWLMVGGGLVAAIVSAAL